MASHPAGTSHDHGPGASRPLRPASWVTSWKRPPRRCRGSRGPYRRRRPPRGRRREVVPSRPSAPDQHRAIHAAEALEGLTVGSDARPSASSRIRSSLARSARAPEALRPRADGASRRAAARTGGRHRLAIAAMVHGAPAAVQRQATSPPQRREAAHARQWSAGATPRRLSSRIALPPFSATRPSPRQQRRRER